MNTISPEAPVQELNELKELNALLGLLNQRLLQVERDHAALIAALSPTQQISCINLLHYLVLRSEDIRDLQFRLHVAGLSSLTSSESHVEAQLTAILERLGTPPDPARSPCTYEQAILDIRGKAAALFGDRRGEEVPYIMVTFETEYAEDYEAVKELLNSGMKVARINCAHDDEAIWDKMIRQVQRASQETGLPCKIYMDLAGPKIRTEMGGDNKKKGKLELEEGQSLLLVGSGDTVKEDDSIPVVHCSMKGIIGQLKAGARVLFDDGIFECVVEKVVGDSATLKVQRISSKKPYLKDGKGINFPDSELDIPSITESDRGNLPFIGRNADVVGYSFVRSAEDVRGLRELLTVNGGKRPFIVLKIETHQAIRKFPELLLQGMQDDVFGIMIARGDLAVELGFERMGEIQEELLWICEAAHVPVIWATQVLDNLNKTGLPTRSEITDAIYSSQAECVMINKGKHMKATLAALTDIFHRSGGHHLKKRYVFRPLRIAGEFIGQL